MHHSKRELLYTSFFKKRLAGINISFFFLLTKQNDLLLKIILKLVSRFILAIKHYILWVAVFFIYFLEGCGAGNHYAPVIDRLATVPSKQDVYIVKKEDTLYQIAWRYGYDYKTLAKINHISYPYTIKPGQKIAFVFANERNRPRKSMRIHAGHNKLLNKKSRARYKPKTSLKTTTANTIKKWLWPAKGNLSEGFSTPGSLNKGINIANKRGTPIYSTAKGEVVYSGNGLSGYGNLIIIKHSEQYLSAYAYNSINLVKEGMQVKAGQKIAEMGEDSSGQAMLHFEIRKQGQPIDPVKLLS